MRSIHDYVIDLRVVSEDEAMLYLEACSDRSHPRRIQRWFDQCARIRWGMLTRAAQSADREELRRKWAESALLGEEASPR